MFLKYVYFKIILMIFIGRYDVKVRLITYQASLMVVVTCELRHFIIL